MIFTLPLILFPFIAATSYRTGLWLLGRGSESQVWRKVSEGLGEMFSTLWINTKAIFVGGAQPWDPVVRALHDVFLPYLIGGIIPGLVFGAIFYYNSQPVAAPPAPDANTEAPAVPAAPDSNTVIDRAIERTREGIPDSVEITLPEIEVNPETYEVRADGELLTCAPAEVLPMAQRYFMF